MIRWLRNRRRKRILDQPFPDGAESALHADVAFYGQLDRTQQRALRDLVQVFIAEKGWVGCAGVDITIEKKAVVAAQACLLLLGLKHNYYRHVKSILIYPNTYQVPTKRVGAAGVVTESRSARLGEAWYRGPIVLSWADTLAGARNAADGRNVVIHEFAHKLDFLDGSGNGTPPLPDRAAMETWREVMTTAYEKLVDRTQRGRATLLNKYGATNPPEFFAVATEAFFEKSRQLQRKHPDLYTVLQDYFGQDPASWLTTR
ncbi:MAG: hypothetical protein CMJ49_14505 [Planctomycetaceae bacterium]|nr:hypothetical protein [Planctomycetaceae bacterium]